MSFKEVKIEDLKGSNDGTVYGATIDDDLYGSDTPVIPRAIDNAPTVQADAIGSGSALFDGTDDYIDVGDFESTLQNSFTVTMWVKPDDGRPSSDEYLIGTVDGEDKFWVRIETDGDIQFYYKEGTTESNRTASAYFSDGQADWTHLAFTLTDSAQAIYANGVSISTGTTSLDTSGFDQSTNRNLKIGASNHYITGAITGFFDGNICQVGIWSAALTQAQIQSIMEKTYEELTASEKTNLVSYWPLDVDASDSHGDNDGTLT